MKARGEILARLLAAALLLGVILAIGVARWLDRRGVVEVHAAMPENGGWSPDGLSVEAGQPLRLRLVSDDVLHSFAVGQSDWPVLDLKPGQPVEASLVFERPGKYVFYCTRWCGANHWRMRGTIEVSGPANQRITQPWPLYVALSLDIDAEHHAEVVPEGRPSAARGAALEAALPPWSLSARSLPPLHRRPESCPGSHRNPTSPYSPPGGPDRPPGSGAAASVARPPTAPGSPVPPAARHP